MTWKQTRDQSMIRFIASLSIATGIAPNELLATDPMMLEDMAYLLEKQRG